jgi:hypothetical protein
MSVHRDRDRTEVIFVDRLLDRDRLFGYLIDPWTGTGTDKCWCTDQLDRDRYWNRDRDRDRLNEN